MRQLSRTCIPAGINPFSAPASITTSKTCSAISVLTYSSQPSSPTYETRWARANAWPISTSFACPNLKSALSRDCAVRGCKISRAIGPITAITASDTVISIAIQCACSGIWRSIQPKSRRMVAAGVITKNSVSDNLVTVTSASIPPRLFSIWV